MDEPRNADEFLLLYFDDQPNLQTWVGHRPLLRPQAGPRVLAGADGHPALTMTPLRGSLAQGSQGARSPAPRPTQPRVLIPPQGVVGRLLSDFLSVMPEEWVFTADDLAAAGGVWPSQRAMLDGGKRLLLVSGTDYGAAMQPLVFARGAGLCGWSEPSLAWVDGAPQCLVSAQGGIEVRALVRWGRVWGSGGDRTSLACTKAACLLSSQQVSPAVAAASAMLPPLPCHPLAAPSPVDTPPHHHHTHARAPLPPPPLQPRPLFDGLLTRVISCELQYGPMNCDFVWRGSNQPVFDEITLPPVSGGRAWAARRWPRCAGPCVRG
jgi:hypothetical protein